MEAAAIVQSPVTNGTMEAINKIQSAICQAGGISKDKTAPAKAGGFAFRGVDDLYNYLGPQVASFGLVMKSFKVTDHKVNFVNSKNGQKLHWVVVVKWTFGCTQDDSKAKYVTVGEAMDVGDKGLNKAITSAFKNLVFPLFVIPVQTNQDSESDHHDLGTANLKFKDHNNWTNLQKMLAASPYLKSFDMTIEKIQELPHNSWNKFWKRWTQHIEKQKKLASRVEQPAEKNNGISNESIKDHPNYNDLVKFLKDYKITDTMQKEHAGWQNAAITEYESIKNKAWKLSQH